jgi:hypothetical protein
VGIDLHSATIFYIKNENREENDGINYSFYDIERQLEIKDPMGNGRIMTRNSYKFKVIKEMLKKIYENYFREMRIKIRELYEIWNPKEGMYNEEKLIEWIDNRIEERSFEEILGRKKSMVIC